MKKRKIVMSVLIVTMLASCMACGNIKDHKDETLKNSVTEKVTVSNTEVAEDTKNIEPVDIKIDDLKPLADNTGNSNAGKHENSGNSSNNNANAGNNGNNNSDNNSNHNGNSNGNNGNHNSNNGDNNGNHNGNNKPTEKPHVHKYVEISRTDPTCTTDGVITKKCSCGDVITESNGKALGHNMVHHNAVTHTEQKLVKDAYDEPIYKNGYQCNVCGKFFNTDDEAGRHVLFECTKGATYSTAHNVIVGYTHHDAVYETVTITDVEAYDECSRCGAR